MAESLSKAVKSTGIKIWKSGGHFMIDINTDSVKVVDRLCTTAVTLSALYVGYKLLRPVIDAAVKKALGGERDDQEVKDIKPGSLHVLLDCLTDQRFLEVLTDYESRKMKARLEEEFSQVGIEVKGLKVEIQNMAEVNEIKEAICKRNLCEDVKNTAMNDAKDDTEKNMKNLKSINESLTELKRKHDQLEENLKLMNESLNISERKQEQLQENLKSTIESLNESKRKRNDLEENLNSMNENLNESREKRNQLEENLNSMNENLNESRKKRNQLEECQAEMKEMMKRMEKNQNKQKSDVEDIKEQFKQFIETFNPVGHQPSGVASSHECPAEHD